MTLAPHYRQRGAAPAITGAGYGFFPCACGQSVLIAGYEARNFLGIAIQCAACGRVSETPGLPEGASPPASVTILDRGTEAPPAAVVPGTVLIGREEMERLAVLYQPRSTEADPYVISDALLDDVEFQQRRWTDLPLPPAPAYRPHPLAWAVARFRDRLRDPDWTGFSDDADMAAVTVIAAFRDLFASWVHHPLFGAMVNTAAADGFSLHAMAMFGAAKALASAGNRVMFVPSGTSRPRIASFQVLTGPDAVMPVAMRRIDRFEWPDGAEATPPAVRAEVLEAMASVQGTINRLRPGLLVLTGGASEGVFERMLNDTMTAAVGSHGRRYRGLAAVASIAPKARPTGQRREARFGYAFFPVPNRTRGTGQAVKVGSRDDHAGFA